MKNSSWRGLAELLLLALAAGGLFYGLHWKRKVTTEDDNILDLYRRLEQLELQNQQLLERIEAMQNS